MLIAKYAVFRDIFRPSAQIPSVPIPALANVFYRRFLKTTYAYPYLISSIKPSMPIVIQDTPVNDNQAFFTGLLRLRNYCTG